ncbi:hypothetical protein EDC01DRAFT_656623 [Geopyxis carbonaria]|nr:hypothetical protein EDC01DRAFT_656623 [Geopyxis carbonaria]
MGVISRLFIAFSVYAMLFVCMYSDLHTQDSHKLLGRFGLICYVKPVKRHITIEALKSRASAGGDIVFLRSNPSPPLRSAKVGNVGYARTVTAFRPGPTVYGDSGDLRMATVPEVDWSYGTVEF